MKYGTYTIALWLLAASNLVWAAAGSDQLVEHNMLMNHGGGHLMDMEGGMVMGMNKDTLPPGCSRVSEDVNITVRAGLKYAKEYPGTMFGFDSHEWRVKPCTRLTVTFINEDRIRHQWMMHGLPKFIYDKGMFHLEATGPSKITGTLILPSEDKTYLVHCDIAQHMEKGMKGQLIVGRGSNPFPSIPGITDLAIPDDYGPKVSDSVKKVAVSLQPAVAGAPPSPGVTSAAAASSGSSSGTFLLGMILGAFGTPFLIGYCKRRYAGMNRDEVIQAIFSDLKQTLTKVVGVISNLLAAVTQKKA